MTRPATEVLADLAAVASDAARLESRRAHLHAELARALTAPARPAAASPEYLTPAEAAEHVGVSVRTLAHLRRTGEGPRWIRLGRAIRYPAWQWARPDGAPESTVRLPSNDPEFSPSAADSV